QPFDLGTDADHFPGDLVARDEREGGEEIAFPDMHVGAADAARFGANENVARPDRRLRDVATNANRLDGFENSGLHAWVIAGLSTKGGAALGGLGGAGSFGVGIVRAMKA